ncbi:MAG: VOC family protein [Deltaproteobacteria bacterium]|nr:VOC family protein [Deltaproteobacteria bacterium]MCH7912817.1 VOC family protein [Deltaproteobacteria bacterium]
MPKVSRLGHFGLRVKSLDRCLPFYRDVLGLEVTGRQDST